MVNNACVFLILVFSTCAVLASEACTQGSEYEPSLCPLNLPGIEKISIEENAAKSPAEKDPTIICSEFKLTERQVRRYFRNAKSVSENDAHYTLDWSPCYTSGKMEFSDGRHGIWSINQFRMGTLVMSNGEKFIQFCPKCQFKPFLW